MEMIMNTRYLFRFCALLAFTLAAASCSPKKDDNTGAIAALTAVAGTALPAGFNGSCTVVPANVGVDGNYCNEVYFSAAPNNEQAICGLGGNGTYSTTTRCAMPQLKSSCKSKYADGHYNLAFYSVNDGNSTASCAGAGGVTNNYLAGLQTVP